MKKSILEWLRDFIGSREEKIPDQIPEVNSETVEKLIAKATGEKIPAETTSENNSSSKTPNNLTNNERENYESAEHTEESAAICDDDSSDPEENKEKNGGKSGSGKGECCSYALKRNIVQSIREINMFARQHGLNDRMVKALLTIAAELVVNALRGKVSGSILLILLQAMNYDKARTEAFQEGQKAGRNEKIMEEYFPSADDGVPQFNGVDSIERNPNNIFSMARKA